VDATGMLGPLGPPSPYAEHAAANPERRAVPGGAHAPPVGGGRDGLMHGGSNGGGNNGGGRRLLSLRRSAGAGAGAADPEGAPAVGGPRRLLAGMTSMMVPTGEWPQLPCFLKQMMNDPSPMDDYANML
jgi:hypothetical protein